MTLRTSSRQDVSRADLRNARLLCNAWFPRKAWVAGRFALTALLSLGAAGVCRADAGSVVHVNPQTTVRGAKITVTVENAPLHPNSVQAYLDGRPLAPPEALSSNLSNTTFSETIGDTRDPRNPAFVQLGTHKLSVMIDGHWRAGDERLNIIDGSQTAPLLTSIEPAAFTSGSRQAEIVLTGRHFLLHPAEDNTITVGGNAIPVIWDGCDQPEAWTKDAQGVAHGSVDSSGTSITLCNIDVPKETSVDVGVRQGTLGESTQKLILSPFSKGRVVFYSVLVDLLGAALILLLVWTVPKYTIENTAYGWLRVLYLDPETNSYSLSKYQFYLWTAAGMFAYSYLAVSKMLVQGLSLPDVPGSLPGIIGIGAGTAVGSQIVTAVRGPKGGGPEKPALGDFITSGGVTAPERVQMFLWTNLGVLAFCIATLRSAPWEIKALPDIGTGLLFLSGLSSAGYLAGKLARKPGPVLSEISITPAWPDGSSAAGAGLAGAGLAGAGAGRASLAQPIAVAQGVLRSAQATLAALPAGGSTGALQAASDALKALQGAIGVAHGAASSGASPSALADFTVAADLAARTAASVFSAEAGAAGEASATGVPGVASATGVAGEAGVVQAAESTRALAEVAQECSAAVQTLASGVTEGVGATQALQAAETEGAGGTPLVRSIDLRGRNLSVDATFEINGVGLPFRMLNPVAGVRGPERVAPEDDPSLSNMGRDVRLNMTPGTMEKPDRANYDAWFHHTVNCLKLRIVNPDGQSAEISFKVPPSTGQAHS